MQSTVTVNRRKKIIDSVRFYEVILDGDDVGIIFNGRSISIPTFPGSHSIKIKIDLGASQELQFSIADGEEIEFECESNISFLAILVFPLSFPYYLSFGRNNWIKLRQIGFDSLRSQVS